MCAECAREPLLKSGVIRSSTIVVAAGENTEVYRSLKELPVNLRRRLRRATNGINSGTILIADKRGSEAIARAMRKLPQLHSKQALRHTWSPRVQQTVAVILIVLTALLICLVFTNRF
jgi:hypothetical protein